MNRLYIAAILLAAVATLCLFSHHYQHHHIDRMLQQLDRIETLAQADDTDALPLAEDFANAYRQVSDRISCYVPHDELTASRETAALLPTLLREGEKEDLYTEIARLRSQLLYLQQIDDPLLRNIL